MLLNGQVLLLLLVTPFRPISIRPVPSRLPLRAGSSSLTPLHTENEACHPNILQPLLPNQGRVVRISSGSDPLGFLIFLSTVSSSGADPFFACTHLFFSSALDPFSYSLSIFLVFFVRSARRCSLVLLQQSTLSEGPWSFSYEPLQQAQSLLPLFAFLPFFLASFGL